MFAIGGWRRAGQRGRRESLSWGDPAPENVSIFRKFSGADTPAGPSGVFVYL